jgi:hypothetical protein
MRIGLIGGLDRSESSYRDIAARIGHSLAFHSGRVGGRGIAMAPCIWRVEPRGTTACR